MKKLFFSSAAIALLVFSSCEDEARNRNENSGNGTANEPISGTILPIKGGFELGLADKIVFENMIIYPITANNGFVEEHKNLGDYKTLKEAIAGGKLLITEKQDLPNYASQNGNNVPQISNSTILASEEAHVQRQSQNNSDGGGRDVNNLSVQNKGDDTVFIMAGELVRGGDQDRVVAEDMVVLPHSKKKDLPVFCVEHGRWTHEGYYNNSEQFSATNNVVSSSLRKIVVKEQQQQEVWNRVADETATNGAASETGTYNSLEQSKDFTSSRDKYIKELENKFEKNEKVIGVIVTDKNNRVIGCDIFCKSKLFREEYKGLIYSYTSEIISDGKKKEKKETISPEQYFAKISNEYKSSDAKIAGSKFVYKGKVIHYSGF